MKHLYRLTIVLITVGFIGTTVFFMLSPDTVPAHYNFAGEVDRMGSKYEYIVFPLFAAMMGAIFLPLAKHLRTQKENGYELAEKVLAVSAIGGVLLFNGMGAYFMWKAVSYTEGAAASVMPVVDGMGLLSLLMGVLLIILGNIMPKVRKNDLFGVRTAWSMSSDEVWRKSQRFGGFASVLAGVLLLVSAVFLKGIVNLLVQTAVLALWVTVCIAASYRYYKAEESA